MISVEYHGWYLAWHPGLISEYSRHLPITGVYLPHTSQKTVFKPIPINHILNPKTHLRLWYHSLRPTLDGDLGSKFLGTILDSFEANWIFELDLALDPSLHLGSPNHELSLWALFLGPNQMIFPIKWCHV